MPLRGCVGGRITSHRHRETPQGDNPSTYKHTARGSLERKQLLGIELRAGLMEGLTAQGAADLAREADGKLVLNFGTGRLMLEGLGEDALSADSFIIA